MSCLDRSVVGFEKYIALVDFLQITMSSTIPELNYVK